MLAWILVALQFLASAFLLLSVDWNPLPWGFLIASIPGWGLAIGAWFRVGMSRIRIHPQSTDQTEFITDGPYGIVRHPMYTGLIWVTLTALWTPLEWSRFAAWIVVVAVLVCKSRIEERSMAERFPGYAEYRTRVGGLIPKWPGAETKKS